MTFDVNFDMDAMTLDAKLDMNPMTLSADIGKVTVIGSGGCGEKLEGKTFTVDGAEVVAESGAERFNVYEGEEQNIATGENSTAFGQGSLATAWMAFASGYHSKATGPMARAQGNAVTASGKMAVAEGTNTVASANNAHAEGDSTQATANNAHTEGYMTKATRNQAHAEGAYSEANGFYTHAEGWRTKAESSYQHVEGKANVEDANGKYLHIVGNGTSDTNRSNAHTLDFDGNAWFSGDVYVGSTSGTNKDNGSKKLATVEDVEKMIAALDVGDKEAY